LTPSQLASAHSKEYVDSVLSCKKPNGFGNFSPDVALSLPWTCGSYAAAACTALELGFNTFSPTSGFHHAHFDSGGGFCTFNGIMIAAQFARQLGATKIGIIDFDQHDSDGCREIIKKLKMDWVQLYSYGSQGPTNKVEAKKWIKDLPKVLFGFEECDLILYNAGMDCHEDDPMGGILSTAMIRQREMYVFETFHRLSIPVATSLAGGYQRDSSGAIKPILDLHDITLRECWNAIQGQKAKGA
jgi:acetoin utilization deacetylase AcuC-like enzyme